MRSLASLFIAPTPERIAAKELHDMRMALFQAERRLLEAQMQVDYYRDMVAFLEDVAAHGVENVVDQRRALTAENAAQAETVSPVPAQPAAQPLPQAVTQSLNPPSSQPSRVSPGLTTVPIVPSAA